ncbi:unnamed protein product [Meloidogyne enterolobii]|uniref:Uncharacterized protein n=1 Tax=Meloidogyne enterolobii TaxID=390850 RepID=A0ACB0Z4C2_MELEN
MSLRLSGSRFKQLGGSTPPETNPTDGKIGPDGSTAPVETTTSGPSSGTEASGSNMVLIIGIVIAVVVL